MACATVLLVVIRVASSDAQPRVIQGVVRDARDQPVPSVSVRGDGVRTTITDDSGRFRLEIAHRNRMTFELRRVGFLPARVGVHAGSDTTISVMILPAAQALPGLEVSATGVRPPSLAGFEQRMLERKRAAGTGVFITADEIEAMKPTRTTQILENVSSVFVRRVGDGRYAIFGRSPGGGDCVATVYLDGIRLAGDGAPIIVRGRYTQQREPGAPIDTYVEPVEIAGAEVYPRGALAPPQFQPPTNRANACAIVAFWTKHG
jgi:hypothetical protein